MLSRTGSISLLFLALTACNQAPEPVPAPTPSDPPVYPATYSTTCTAIVNAYATWQTGCLGVALPAGRVDDLIAHCSAREALPGITAPEAAFKACAVEIPLSSCAELPIECLSPIEFRDNSALGDYLWAGSAFGDLRYDLFPRAQGTLAAGAPCSIAGQCQSGACTSYDSCGLCFDPRATGETCGATALCVGYRDQCVDGVCVEIGLTEGSPCQDVKGDSDCLSSLYCHDGMCTPRLKLGSPCPEFPPACPQGSLCVGALCMPVVEVHEGQACNYASARCTGEGLECIDGLCRRPVDNAGEGADCAYDFCAPGLKCSGFTCVVPGEAGESCDAYDACAAGLTCLHGPGAGGTCGKPLSDGAQCYELRECAGGSWCYFTGSKGICVSEGAAGMECGDRRPCHGAEICHEGVCGALDVCAAPQ